MHNPFITIIALALLFFLARSAWNVHRSADLISNKLSQTEEEADKLRLEQQSLSAKVDNLSTPDGIESELRVKYRAVKDGESVAVIVNNDQASTSNVVAVPEKGWWESFIGWFGF